ncbi:uncharacterized protein LOC134240122 [Saccostrea cucullata]|uniref:uncharacterized protein LOC134240122 n=1 Tax=Saccostrea cuccullata TaxID=36930 RepID=UPI002ED52958
MDSKGEVDDEINDEKSAEDSKEILYKKQPNNYLCSLCEYVNEKVPATMVCIDDDILLCNGCGFRHKAAGSTKDHRVPSLTEYIKEEFTCYLCKSVNEVIPGYAFCNDSNEHVLFDDVKGLALHLSQPMVPSFTHVRENNLWFPVDKIDQRHPEPESIAQNHPKHDYTTGSQQPVCDERESSSKEKKRNKKDKKKLGGRLRRSRSSLLEPKMDTPSMTCGKPVLSLASFDTIEIRWEEPSQGVDYYTISFKRKIDDKWKDFPVQWKSNRATITGLQSDTPYEFKVLCVKDNENKIQSESSIMNTTQSPAAKYVRFSSKQKDGNPAIFKLPPIENMKARNEKDKTRELIIGDPKGNTVEEKTLMLVGATGSGKSTLVDGIINYILGVQFHDKFRFTVVELEEDEQKSNNQALSQTEWVTVYRVIPDRLSKIRYTLNIIDTPGFGDTRGIQRDNKIIDQIRSLFSSNAKAFLDAVCFIAKSPDARLTAVQTYIFNQIMALFGKDMENNFCSFITFADEQSPPVLACLKSANLPARIWFKFNNSGLFASNKDNVAKPSWDMGWKSFENFFKGLHQFQAKSLTLTKEVLEEREKLQTILSNIQPQVSAGLTKLNELRDQISTFLKHKNDLKDNKDFTYETQTVKQIQEDLEKGVYVTNCLICNITCHYPCGIPDDGNKINCFAMTNGFCRICEKKCKWDEHKNAKYRFRYETVTETRTYEEMKKNYEKARGEKLTHGKYLQELQKDVESLYLEVQKMMRETMRCKNRLNEIALRPDPLSTTQHIDQMIQAEEFEKNPGFQNRIKMLQDYKLLANTDRNVERVAIGLYNMREEVKNALDN